LYNLEHERLTATPNANPTLLANLAARVARYEQEQKEISVEAKRLEHARDEARELANAAATSSREMGLATSVFQIAIALGGITLIVKKRWLWYVSMLAGVLASW
jgi:Na+-translocating ferredoxin:NAD+ oxidoreductase RnfD subunit